MASLKALRMRINSVKSTRKITQAMKMVAAAKLRRAQQRAEAARPYAERMERMLASLGAAVAGQPDAPKLLVGTGRSDRHLVVVATSDRGMAGGFNTAIIRAAREKINELTGQGKDVKLLVVGKKARDQLKRQYGDRFVAVFEAGVPSMANAQPVADKITELFEAGEIDVVTLAFSRFKSVVSQVPTVTQLIPAQVQGGGATIDLKGAAYEYEPGEEEILETLLPRNLTVQVLSAMLENQAGFYAAQMTAMDNATRNAGDMIASLTLQYNRSRQAQITKELIEIISGAEAL